MKIYLLFQCPGPGESTRDVNPVYIDFIRTKGSLIGRGIRPISGGPVATANEDYDHVVAVDSGDYHVLYLVKGGFWLLEVL